MSSRNISALVPAATDGFPWLMRRPPHEDDRLPSEAEEAALRRDLTQALQPISSEALQRHIGAMVMSFPQQGPVDHRSGYILALSEHLSEFPAEAVAAATRKAVRTQRFLPAVAEVVSLAEHEIAPLRAALLHMDRLPYLRRVQQLRAEEAARAERLRIVWERVGELFPDDARRARWRLQYLDSHSRRRLAEAAGDPGQGRLDALIGELLS